MSQGLGQFCPTFFFLFKFDFVLLFRLKFTCERTYEAGLFKIGKQSLNPASSNSKQIQWEQLNGITDNGINRIVESILFRFTRPKLLCHT